ncbi:hypothetical protein PZ938_13200 [Luteipulveratus sp. YIM 133132]|uniref:hypothetical protein n=1 Tax=Luteipulveratus flavus TaxID=3031728 RepID=UPI0023B0887A|nr:hypothetical protein [Luteipulveratus sp. YIM 133132]MDE9366563.1 hypothetical protein [Luteipulveratus sp. YIM 133132]
MSNSEPDVAPALSRRWWIVAVGALAAAVIGIVVVVLPGGGSTTVAGAPTGSAPSATAPAPSPPATSAGGPAPSSSASFCGLPAGSQVQPQAGPGGDWKDVGTLVAAPQDARRFGPGRIGTGSSTTCFAHSPTGALFAGAAFMAGASDDRTGADQARAMLLDGPGKQKFIDTMHEPGSSSGSDIGHGNVSGFRILSYSKDQARVSVSVSFPDNVFAALTVDLAWRHGDWKVTTLPDGSLPGGEVQVITSLDGFTPWIPTQGD